MMGHRGFSQPHKLSRSSTRRYFSFPRAWGKEGSMGFRILSIQVLFFLETLCLSSYYSSSGYCSAFWGSSRLSREANPVTHGNVCKGLISGWGGQYWSCDTPASSWSPFGLKFYPAFGIKEIFLLREHTVVCGFRTLYMYKPSAWHQRLLLLTYSFKLMDRAEKSSQHL